MDPGDENNFKVLQLGLEHRPRGQEVDGLGEAVVDDGGGGGDVAERDGHVVGGAVLVSVQREQLPVGLEAVQAYNVNYHYRTTRPAKR